MHMVEGNQNLFTLEPIICGINFAEIKSLLETTVHLKILIYNKIDSCKTTCDFQFIIVYHLELDILENK